MCVLKFMHWCLASTGAKPKVVVEEDLSHIEPLVLWEPSEAEKEANPNAAPIVVEPFLCKWLRPHQVRFSQRATR